MQAGGHVRRAGPGPTNSGDKSKMAASGGPYVSLTRPACSVTFPPGPGVSSICVRRGEGIRGLVADVVADMRARGETVPEPLAERAYSGKFQTRVPPELHRRLAIEAAEEGVSLNRLVSLRLAMAWVAVASTGKAQARR
jgi:hypothetical protein